MKQMIKEPGEGGEGQEESTRDRNDLTDGGGMSTPRSHKNEPTSFADVD